ncbi:MAG TPA: hypothetical protein EYG81_06080 [Archaeoglobus profundus]|nr:hypothetical protein [Archaeoglobus profundus]
MIVGWDASHSEFTIDDYYYFSKLRRYAEKEGIEVYEVKNFNKLGNYDVIVFNYPEKDFRSQEIGKIKRWLKSGKRIIFASYYGNMDGVSERINRVLTKLNVPVRINNDVIMDPENNMGDLLFPKAKYKDYIVVMPCSASIAAKNNVLISSFDGARSHPTGLENPVFGVKLNMGGELVVLGTCVFWDNYSIDVESNKILALDLLKKK